MTTLQSYRAGFLAILSLAVLLSANEALAESSDSAEIIEVRKVWDQAKHNAFTDLIRHQDRWYCVFREATKHTVSYDGSLRVLTSTDGENWTSAALITMPETDLRDAKISITPDGKLMLCGYGRTEGERDRQTYVWFSEDGKTWSDAHPIGDRGYWIWRIVWHNGAAYGIGYKGGDNRDQDGHVRLYKGDDGKTFETLVPDLGPRSYPNETSLLFLEDGMAICVLRRDGKAEQSALLGKAQAPYTNWKWEDLGVRIGGPEAIRLPDGRFIVAGRKYPGGAKTQLWWLDPSSASLKEAVELPSNGDSSYPGLVFHDGQLWVSYYSSHEGKSNIYVARVRFQ
ncbi:MAG TPA: sialidase family protein [Planctomicrobium sp.]|nr:sialidase family protein [Planctomicrobium sp.]